MTLVECVFEHIGNLSEALGVTTDFFDFSLDIRLPLPLSLRSEQRGSLVKRQPCATAHEYHGDPCEAIGTASLHAVPVQLLATIGLLDGRPIGP
jgi:hypothetical protein